MTCEHGEWYLGHVAIVVTKGGTIMFSTDTENKIKARCNMAGCRAERTIEMPVDAKIKSMGDIDEGRNL